MYAFLGVAFRPRHVARLGRCEDMKGALERGSALSLHRICHNADHFGVSYRLSTG